MSTLQWSDDLALGVGAMDQTHIEFVDLLAEVQQAPDDTLLAKWAELIDHTQVHFDNENRWMVETRFAAGNCHTTHHKAVLDVMRDGLRYGQQGHRNIVRQMAAELTTWFPQHADSMDAALAWHLKRVGYDPVSGSIAHPELLPGELIHGCGGETCSDENVPAADTAPTPASA
ncbi:hemerythrin domain-containing protein [Brachymonas denitrificans]|uniref:hemerythrin domain-containing protein n=1 Tax=Brachymonas denitrificans TaxID=28220 RepID=UPI001BD17BCD|nr:hemerythrin domain-containing protein [Brachymonas denitrificans]